jgi:DNA primase
MAVDTDAVRRQHPLADVVGGYGIELRRSGSTLIGRCPFHADGGRPNLTVYGSGRWVCYRCGERGDVIGFVQQMEHLGFRDAVARLDGAQALCRQDRPLPPPVRPAREVRARLGPEELEVLSAAVELYANRLLSEGRALTYLAGRGFARSLLERYRVGFAAGGELAAYLRWRHLPLLPAMRVGLLDRDGQEVFRDRIVVPEQRHGQPVWLIGRQLDQPGQASGDYPKYLGLPGRKPLLGWEEAVAAGSARVTVVEGPLDWLTLRAWGVPALSLCGSLVRPAVLAGLERFARVYLALDADDGGKAGSQRLLAALGARAVRVHLPAGCKDVAELAPSPDGATLFAAALQAAENAKDGLLPA